jgi:hypothetical protein
MVRAPSTLPRARFSGRSTRGRIRSRLALGTRAAGTDLVASTIEELEAALRGAVMFNVSAAGERRADGANWLTA